MTQQLIDTSTPNSGQGDQARTAFNKINQNFTDLYTTPINLAASSGVFTIDNSGNTTITALTGDLLVITTTNQKSTSNTFSVAGYNVTQTPIVYNIRCGSGGSVTAGTSTNFPVVNLVNGIEVFRMEPNCTLRTVSGNESTGAGVTALGSNCPAVTVTAPYTWIRIHTSDGSICYIPAWK